MGAGEKVTDLSKCVVKYRSGYKYQLTDDYTIPTGVIPAEREEDDYLILEKDGTLTIKRGYAWDGPSGPAIDSQDFMRGSLVHDALYQLIEDGRIPGFYRELADNILYNICREDGMSAVRAWYVFKVVRAFGGSHVRGPRPVRCAP